MVPLALQMPLEGRKASGESGGIARMVEVIDADRELSCDESSQTKTSRTSADCLVSLEACDALARGLARR
jgi:hypothetical protein